MDEARVLVIARQTGEAVELNERLSRLDGESAYAIQRATVAARGGMVVGYKIGWADPVARAAAGVPKPVFGRYVASDLRPEGGTVGLGEFIQPSVEGEFAVVVEREMSSSGVDLATVREACRLTLAFDLCDSRLVGGAASWQAAAADDCGAGLVVVGATRGPMLTRAELSGVELSLSRDGEVLDRGTGQRIDDPAETVAWLARRLAAEGEILHPGQFVLLGAVAGPVPLGEGGSWEAGAPGYGSVRVAVVGPKA